MSDIKTKIHLPPGTPSVALVRTLLELLFTNSRCFTPAGYGGGPLDHPAGANWVKQALDYYSKCEWLYVGTAEESFSIHPVARIRSDQFPYMGNIRWRAPIGKALNSAWLNEHTAQVIEVMRLVGSPVAFAAHEDCLYEKSRIGAVEGTSSVDNPPSVTTARASSACSGATSTVRRL
jgi:hypothetical protein